MKKLLISCALSLIFITSPLKAETTSAGHAAHKKYKSHKSHPTHHKGTHTLVKHKATTHTQHHAASKEKAVETKHNAGFLGTLLGGGAAAATTDKVIGTTASGKTIYLGPRGGHYYINDHGNKEYLVQEK